MHHTTHKAGHAPATEGRLIRSWATFYDAVAWAMSLGQIGKLRKQTVRAAALKPGEAVLDVGCGTGQLTLRAARKVGAEGRVAGIDASPEMIRVAEGKAKKAGRAIDFRVAPIEQLPFGDGEFDAVLSSLMLHHLPDEVKTAGLREVKRVLKPGGRLIAVDIAGHGHLAAVTSILGFGHRMPPDYAKRVTAAMTAAGFQTVEKLETKQKGMLFLRAS